jgi:hypothetical protein
MARQVTGRRKGAFPGGARRYAVEIVLIDQAPLRREIAAECAEIMQRLEVARAGWHHFERKDRPAFVRWRAREFGALLSEARDVEIQIHDAQTLVREVEVEMRRMFQSPQSAYQRIMFRRENPGMTVEDQSPHSEAGAAGATRKVSEFEQEALFQEWVQKFLGTNPDKMDDDAYTVTFEVFKSHMFKSLREEGPSSNARSSKVRAKEETARKRGDQGRDDEPDQESETTVDARVKGLYRRLVRQLHPDLRADGSADVSALWHEVQEAYAASDVARMEILLALSHMRANEMDDQTSLSQMCSVLAELERSLRALEKSLLEAEEEDAWNFAQSGPNEHLKMRMERQLKFDLTTRVRHLDMLRKTIADWARGPVLSRPATSMERRQFV